MGCPCQEQLVIVSNSILKATLLKSTSESKREFDSLL